MPRAISWGRATAEWSDGSTRTAWLRAGDANDFTTCVLAESALRILDGHASPGTGTPVQLLGLDLVEAAGGEVSSACGDRGRPGVRAPRNRCDLGGSLLPVRARVDRLDPCSPS